jgi:hypothetical protein
MKRPEQQIHKAVISHLRQRGAPGLLFWHTDNNVGIRGRKGAIQGAIKKSLGVRAGVSDIVAFYNRQFFALELKAPGEKPNDDQWKFIDGVTENGGFAFWADNLDAALDILESWGLLKGRAA